MRAGDGRANETQSKLVGLLLGVLLAASVGAAFWFATDRSDDQPVGPNSASVTIAGCPTDIVLDTSPLCSIITENVVEATWQIDGFGSGPVEKIDTEWQMFINPTNPEVVGMDFTLVVTATGRDGADVRTTHYFTVVE